MCVIMVSNKYYYFQCLHEAAIKTSKMLHLYRDFEMTNFFDMLCVKTRYPGLYVDVEQDLNFH